LDTLLCSESPEFVLNAAVVNSFFVSASHVTEVINIVLSNALLYQENKSKKNILSAITGLPKREENTD